MRRTFRTFSLILIPLAGAAAAACSVPRAPGTPLTDVAATSTENTGPYDVVERRIENGTRYLRVEADQPQRADLIARNLVYQLLSYSPQAIVIDVSGRTGTPRAGEKHTIKWARGHHGPLPPQPSSPGTGAADHRGTPSGQ